MTFQPASPPVRAATYVLDLAACGPDVAAQVGGKAAGLGRLLLHGFPVPPGFVVTTSAYRDCLAAAGIESQIDEILATHAANPDQRAASALIQALFSDAFMGDGVEQAIRAAYDALGEQLAVAVRSSATAEDLADASFAGQQDTYLWLTGADAVVAHVLRCWASLFTAQAIAYRARFQVSPEALAMGVVVQQMVPAATAGVMMTLEPVSGDRSAIYLEAALGLGEGVVRGDVPTDRYWVGKTSRQLEREEIAVKDRAHRFDAAGGDVRLMAVDPHQGAKPCLTHPEALALALLGGEVEDAFGAPMDIEWAIDQARDVFLLQARPETVWSTRDPLTPEPWDATHRLGAPDEWYSRDNVGEAMPGVATPLTWSLWGPIGELNARMAAFNLGVLSRKEAEVPADPAARYVQAFYGRIAMRARLLATIGDRMPGVSGADVVRGIFAEAPSQLSYEPTRRRYPFIAARLPLVFLRTPRRIRALAAQTDVWWAQEIEAMGSRDRASAAAALARARERFAETLILHSTGLVGVVQPLYDALEKLVARAGVGDVGVLGGTGGAEMAIVGDIWRASRNEIVLAQVLQAHGFHGPSEGELSGLVWREDPAPIVRLIAEYAARDASHDPAGKGQLSQRQSRAMRAQVLAATPALQRPAVRLLLRLAAARLPLRGVGKRSYVQSLDVARAAARRIGALEHAAGRIGEVDDVFYLTFEELTGSWPADAPGLITARRDRREAFLALDLPVSWRGNPELSVGGDDAGDEALDVVQGVGVSAGVVEGPARVVSDPGFAEVQPDEVLVAPTTDPSWSSIMFVSAALVVDIGGALSHAAVVARELGLPCVVSTRTGTRAIRTGDRVRVDGAAGTVEILERAPQPAGLESS